MGSMFSLLAVDSSTPFSCEHDLLLPRSLTVAVASDKIGVRGPGRLRAGKTNYQTPMSCLTKKYGFCFCKIRSTTYTNILHVYAINK